jgi:membrane-anchored glycerophosphoryl diester phosphodiesterase (GDPDase)
VLRRIADTIAGRTQAALTGILMALTIGLGILVGVVLYVRYALAVPACVLEDIKARQAIRRSIRLSLGSRGRIFVIYVLMLVVSYIIAFLFLIPVSMLGRVIGRSSPALLTALSGLAGFLAGALAGPIATIALSLVYYDQRVRKEAFDIELMVAALDGAPPLAGGQSAGVAAG